MERGGCERGYPLWNGEAVNEATIMGFEVS